ncbi:MAG TPA: hypothetical protein VEB64_11080 [Azospirillaceae bacterium]|nr:hypothetical protein [Azospirillaceae bacterium]
MDVTATITANNAAGDSASAERRQASYRGAAAVAVVVGGLLLALGIPRLVAAVLALDARPVVWNVYGGATVPGARLTRAAADLAAAGRWVSDGEQDGDRSLLLLRAAEAATTERERSELLSAAEQAVATALAAASGQPSEWVRLAHLRHRRGDTAGAVAALRLSMLSGSFVPALMTSRVEFGLQLLPVLDREMVELLKRQIRQTWVIAPQFVSELGTRPEAGALVRDALAGLSEDEMNNYLRLHGIVR